MGHENNRYWEGIVTAMSVCMVIEDVGAWSIVMIWRRLGVGSVDFSGRVANESSGTSLEELLISLVIPNKDEKT